MNGISKAIALYLAPVLALTATILSLLAFLAPTLLLHDRVALVTVFPSTELSQSGSTQSVDGPSVFLGSLGSCARPYNDAPVECTFSSVSPQFDFSSLPKNAPTNLLSAPGPSTPVFISVALALDVAFLITFTVLLLRHKVPGKVGNALGTPLLQNVSAGIGFMGFMIGLTAFLILRMWFGKAVQDFNLSIQAQNQGLKLVAEVGNAFTMIWVAHAFWVVPVMIALTKYHVNFT